jgi:PIN domain nuclease of toxin-antitoxin system
MPMTPDDICQLLQTADVTLAFDTSVTVRRGFLSLCDQANWINERKRALGLLGQIRLCVPAAAHTERLFDLAQQHGERYDVTFVRRMLRQRRVEVPSFSVQDAEHCAELLAQRYKTPAEWYAFKKKRCLECVGLPPQQHDLAQGSGQKCGAPNDWLIIAQARRENAILVMDDKGRGDECDLVGRVARSGDVRAALDRVLDELIA